MSADPALIARLEAVSADFAALADRMADPQVAGNPDAYRELATRYAELEPLVKVFGEYRESADQLRQAEELLDEEADAELRELAQQEVGDLRERCELLQHELQALLLPRDPDDEKNVILEVRAGTGGDEATLFAAELLRMYQRYAENRGWSFELVGISESEVGGVKEAVANISGKGVYSRLKFESGVHRVQRVPTTETQGRVHTSAATVAILPEAEEVEVQIDEKDLRLDSFRSSGPGGQSVNKTTSAVRVTHIPTGLVVQCQDEKSWHKNRARALKVLRARLYDRQQEELHRREAAARKVQVGSGDRSEKIRTYNFPQNRVTDHRIKLTLHRLEAVLLGELDELIDGLATADQAARLAAEASGPAAG